MTDKEDPTRKVSDQFMLTLHIVDRIYSLLSLSIRYGLPTWALVRIAEALAGKFLSPISPLKFSTMAAISPGKLSLL